MPIYEVGTLYHPGKTRWQAGTDFNYRAGEIELRMFFTELTPSDINAIRSGPCSFYLANVEDTLFFLFEFGHACPLLDNSYSWWLVSEEERTMPPVLKPGETAVLSIILVSAEDGIIRALRRISLGHDFSVALYDAIREQTTQPISRERHDYNIGRVYNTYFTSEALLARAFATCIVEGRESNQ